MTGTDAWTDTPPVLMYHSISPSAHNDPHRVRVHPRRLEQHLGLLHRIGLRGVCLAELLQAQQEGVAARLVGLTFDDGYADFAQYAAPVLARYGMTATLYVVPGLFGGENVWDTGPRLRLIDRDQARAVADAGHEIGSHTLTHLRLPSADPAAVVDEVVRSRDVLQELLQRPVPGFCYPYGDFDAAVISAVRAAGYAYACVTGDYRPGGRFALPRCYVSPDDRVPHVIARMVRHHARQWVAGRSERVVHGQPAGA